MLPSAHLEPGVVAQKCSPTPGILDIGRIPRRTDDLDEAIAADLRRAGFESQPRPDIMAWKYRKLVLNLGNGVDAVCAAGRGGRRAGPAGPRRGRPGAAPRPASSW